MNKNNRISFRINKILIDIFNGNQSEFARKIGVGESRIRSYLTGTLPKADVLEKIVSTLAISCDWLLAGQGPMLRDEAVVPVKPQQVFSLKTDKTLDNQLVPLYDLEATAGLVSLFVDEKIMPTGYVSIPDLPLCDGAVHIRGDSMYPILKSGDMVFYKRINDIVNNLIWGEMYLISFDMDGEEYVTVKYIQKSEIADHITLVSYNQHHKPFDIHLSRVRALAFIKASLRINSVK